MRERPLALSIDAIVRLLKASPTRLHFPVEPDRVGWVAQRAQRSATKSPVRSIRDIPVALAGAVFEAGELIWIAEDTGLLFTRRDRRNDRLVYRVDWPNGAPPMPQDPAWHYHRNVATEMKRAWSRFTLKVTKVHEQKFLSISVNEMRAEGYRHKEDRDVELAFNLRWQAMYGAHAPAMNNPLVRVITFELHQVNIAEYLTKSA